MTSLDMQLLNRVLDKAPSAERAGHLEEVLTEGKDPFPILTQRVVMEELVSILADLQTHLRYLNSFLAARPLLEDKDVKFIL